MDPPDCKLEKKLSSMDPPDSKLEKKLSAMDPPDCKLEKKLSSMDPPDYKLEKKLSGPHDYKLEKATFILGGFLSCFITSLFYLMFPRYFLGTELVTSLCLEEKNGVSKISRNHKPGRTGGIHSAVYLYEKLLLANQMYYAVTIDRTTAGPFIISWRNGGTSIEGTVEKKFPYMIIKVHIDVSKGIMDEDAAKVVDYLAPKLVDRKESIEQVKRLYNLFCDYDRTLLEINPIAETSDGQLITADPKLSFYDNAAFHQKEIVTLWDSSHEDPREVAAAKAGLNYIGLDGEIGCIVNGAGLAMATMDVIKLIGGTPASFLFVGGNASEDQVVEAFKILTSDEKVKAILVNIFGRIMKCDVIATGIVNAAKQVQLKVPVVVRLEGRNVDQGMRILKESGMTLITAEALYDAAVKAVQAALF